MKFEQQDFHKFHLDHAPKPFPPGTQIGLMLITAVEIMTLAVLELVNTVVIRALLVCTFPMSHRDVPSGGLLDFSSMADMKRVG